MKILMIIDSLGSGGAQRQLVTLAAGLVARGHHVEVYTYHDRDHFKHVARKAGVILRSYAKRFRYSPGPILALRRLVANCEYDGVLAFLETPSIYAELACLGKSGPPLVVSERSSCSPATLGCSGRIKQELHRVADWITVNSYHQHRIMVEMFPWMKPRSSVIWNGVDVDHFAAQGLPVRRSGALRVQVLASLARNKNPLGLAKAIAICRDNFALQVEVGWAGASSVSGEGGIAKIETDKFLSVCGLAEQWRWDDEVRDVRGLLASCDALVHPSFAEGLPNAVCEALSSGRPVLLSDIGDHSRLIDGGANGLLFDPHDPLSIADSLAAFAEFDSERRQEMAEAARRFAEEQLPGSAFVRSYEDLFAKLKRR